MTSIQKTHFADDDTLLYIKQLEDRCKALELSARKANERAEDLKAALRFYADRENYKAHVIRLDELEAMAIIPVCDDRGEIARRALND